MDGKRPILDCARPPAPKPPPLWHTIALLIALPVVVALVLGVFALILTGLQWFVQ